MKQFKRVGFLTALICATSLLIAAFILLFSYAGCAPNNKSIGNVFAKNSIPNESIAVLKTNTTIWK